MIPNSEDVQQDPHRASSSTSHQCRGEGLHGCQHYRRRCKLLAPCCGEVFACRHCHNDEKQARESVSFHHLEIPPHCKVYECLWAVCLQKAFCPSQVA